MQWSLKETFAAHADESLPTPIGGSGKRLFDVIAAVVALVALATLFLCVAALIGLVDGRPILIKHTRVGFGGKLFPCLKFRTMVVNADEALTTHLTAHPTAMDEWRRTQKLKCDPRVTPVGRILRQLSIDELPQLVNILQGDMSVVGPRPIVVGEMERYGVAINDYLAARPGLTGLWQVSGRSDTTYEARVNFDRDYVQNWSMSRDIEIIVRTVPVVFRTRGTC